MLQHTNIKEDARAEIPLLWTTADDSDGDAEVVEAENDYFF